MKKLPCIFLVGKKNLDGPTWHLATLNRKCHATERNVVAFLSRLPPPFSRLPPSDGPTSLSSLHPPPSAPTPLQSPVATTPTDHLPRWRCRILEAVSPAHLRPDPRTRARPY